MYAVVYRWGVRISPPSLFWAYDALRDTDVREVVPEESRVKRESQVGVRGMHWLAGWGEACVGVAWRMKDRGIFICGRRAEGMRDIT